MNFQETDIIKILQASIKNRFQDFTPSEFEDFIAKVFQDKGYYVEQTNYSGDYGADLIITKENIKTAVQIKRYKKTNKVGVQDINQIIGAKSYYNCDRALILTTSSYSKQGENLAKETSVEYWNWENLLNLFKELYWNNKDFYTFYANSTDDSTVKTALKIEFGKIDALVELKGGELGTIVHITVENLTRNNINLKYELPVLITQDFEQIEANYWLSTSFKGGVIYAGCKVDIGYIFSYDNLKKIEHGDKIISKFTLQIGDSPEVEKEYFSIYGLTQQTEELNLYDERILNLEKQKNKLENEIEYSEQKFVEQGAKLETFSNRQKYLIVGIFVLIITIIFLLK